MAWVLGYIAADGCVMNYKNKPYFNLPSIDKETLEKVKRAMDSEHPIHIQSKPGVRYFQTDGKYHYCSNTQYQFLVSRRTIVEDLIKLGITPRKSNTLQMPPVPQKYLRHFIRGYMDGDGFISRTRNETKYKVRYCIITNLCSGSRNFLEAIKQATEKVGFKSGLHADKTAWQLVFCGEKFPKWLYKNKGNCYMERKFNKFQDLLAMRRVNRKGGARQTIMKTAFN